MRTSAMRRFLIACLAPALAAPAFAATFTVNTLDDEDDGIAVGGVSLRDAIAAANANDEPDTINFSVTGTILLNATLPPVQDDLTIIGPGVDMLSINGQGAHRILFVNTGQTTITGVQFANGRAAGGHGGGGTISGGGGGAAGMGGAIFVNASASVVVSNCDFLNNAAIGGNGGSSNTTFPWGGAGGGGGFGASGSAGIADDDGPGGSGGSGGALGGIGGLGAPSPITDGEAGTPDGAGGGGGGMWTTGNLPGTFGGAGSYGGGGGGGGAGLNGANGGAGGFGAGGGGAGGSLILGGLGGPGGTHAGVGGIASSVGGMIGSGGGGGGAGLGGAIFARSGSSLHLHFVSFRANSASGGEAGGGGVNAFGGQGKGGGMYVQSGATATYSVINYGSGGDANVASDDLDVPGDDNNVFGTLGVIPVVTSVTRLTSSPTNVNSVGFNVTFNENVTGIDVSDFEVVQNGVTGAMVVAVGGDGMSYTVAVQGFSGNGTIGLTVLDDDSIIGSSAPLGGVGIGNGVFTEGEVYTIDQTPPTVQSVTVTPVIGSAFTGNSVQLDITMSEAVTDFGINDVLVQTDGTLSISSLTTSTPDPAQLRIELTDISGEGQLTIQLQAGAVTDLAGNPNAAADLLTSTRDVTAPTVISVTPSLVAPTNADSVNFNVIFSEPVTGFDAPTDVTVGAAGVTHTGVTITPNSNVNYTVTVTGVAGDGQLTVAVNAGAAVDAAGLPNVASVASAAVPIDNMPPEIISFLADEEFIVDATTATFTLTASEALDGFTAEDVEVLHSTTSSTGINVVSVTPQVFKVEVTGLSGEGAFFLRVQAGAFTDAAGNPVPGPFGSTASERILSSNENMNSGGPGGNDNENGSNANVNAPSNSNTNSGGAPPPPACGMCGPFGIFPIVGAWLMAMRTRIRRTARRS